MGSKPSELSEFIKANLGRTSSKLVQSFRTYLGTRSLFPHDSEEVWKITYPDWIKTVRQLPKSKNSVPSIDLAKLYRTIENLTVKLTEEKDKSKRAVINVTQSIKPGRCREWYYKPRRTSFRANLHGGFRRSSVARTRDIP